MGSPTLDLGQTPQESNMASRQLPKTRDIELPWLPHNEIKYKDKILKINNTVELQEDPVSARNGDFLKIKHIFQNMETDEIVLRGLRLRRTRRFLGGVPRLLNELIMLINLNDGDDEEQAFELGQEDVPIIQVLLDNGKPCKRKAILTNQEFPLHSFREHGVLNQNVSNYEDQLEFTACKLELVCRWVFIAHPGICGNTLPKHAVLRRLTEMESDTDKSVPDVELERAWRGVPDGLKEALAFGDGFCGAGGVSVGAREAGFENKWAFDQDPDAAATYRLNFPDALFTLANVADWLVLQDGAFADVVHLSPPCQYFSPANTGKYNRDHTTEGGQRDETNSAVSLCISAVLKKARPRVMTLENTSGLIQRHSDWFTALISQFTALTDDFGQHQGYSLRWKLMDMAEYGCPHKRERLIVFASCPGGVLPQFPAPTHGAGPGRLPFTTIDDWTLHVNASHGQHVPTAREGPLSRGDRMLTNTITTSGTEDCHPTGRRFTVRELACLMTLPVTFGFPPNQAATASKKQIGNMVPALGAEVMMRAIKAALEQEDLKRAFVEVVELD